MRDEGNNYDFLLGSMDYRHPFYTGSIPYQRKLYAARASWNYDPFILADHAGDYGSQRICQIYKRITKLHLAVFI
jgi:hypothetical protein